MLNCDTCDQPIQFENAVITQHPTRRNRDTLTQCPTCSLNSNTTALRELIKIRPDLATQATNLLQRGYHIESTSA